MSEDNLSKNNYFSDGDTSDSDYEGDKNFDEIYRYNCPNCSKKFITKPSLNKHLSNVVKHHHRKNMFMKNQSQIFLLVKKKTASVPTVRNHLKNV